MTIVYTSKTGFTREYAQMLGRAAGLPVFCRFVGIEKKIRVRKAKKLPEEVQHQRVKLLRSQSNDLGSLIFGRICGREENRQYTKHQPRIPEYQQRGDKQQRIKQHLCVAQIDFPLQERNQRNNDKDGKGNMAECSNHDPAGIAQSGFPELPLLRIVMHIPEQRGRHRAGADKETGVIAVEIRGKDEVQGEDKRRAGRCPPDSPVEKKEQRCRQKQLKNFITVDQLSTEVKNQGKEWLNAIGYPILKIRISA